MANIPPGTPANLNPTKYVRLTETGPGAIWHIPI